MPPARFKTTLIPKGQMTLPAAVCSQLGLEAGDQLSVTVLDAETIVLERRASLEPWLRSFAGPAA